MRGKFDGCPFAVRVEDMYVFRSPLKQKIPGSGGKRGKIRGFSSDSRLRLMLALRKYNAFTHIITLTFPCDFGILAGRCLERFIRSFFPYPFAHYVYVKEFQARGVIHFHLLVESVGEFSISSMACRWAQIVCDIYHDEFDSGGDVPLDEMYEAIRWVHDRSDRKFIEPIVSNAQRYVAKYLSKAKFEASSGRWWGSCRCRSYVSMELYRGKDYSSLLRGVKSRLGFVPKIYIHDGTDFEIE